MNHTRKSGSKRRGKHTFITYKEMKEKFGASAKLVRDQKYEMESKRDPNVDPEPWWTAHPDVPNDKDRHIQVTYIFWVTYSNMKCIWEQFRKMQKIKPVEFCYRTRCWN